MEKTNLDLLATLPVYFQVTSSKSRLLSSGMCFLSQAQQWTCWSVGEIMKKLEMRTKSNQNQAAEKGSENKFSASFKAMSIMLANALLAFREGQ